MEERNPLLEGFARCKNIANNISRCIKSMGGKVFKNKDINFDNINNTYIKNKYFKKALAGFMIASILGIGYTGYKVNEIRTRSVDVYIDQVKIGTVRNEEDVLEVVHEIREDISEKHNINVKINDNIKLEPSHSKDSGLISKNDLKSGLKSKIGFLVTGCAIVIDGEEIGVLNSKEEAENVIKTFKKSYIEELSHKNLKKAKILEEIEFVKKDIPLNKMNNEEELLEIIKTGSEKIKTHTIEVGENFWTIAKIYGTTMEELEKANPDKDGQYLQIGDEIRLVMPAPKLTVETIEEIQYEEAVDYDVKVELNNSMYKNQKKVKVEGVRGETKITANIVRHNGIEIEKNIVSEEVVKKPTDRIVVKGTKDVPRTVATGTFLMPTRGRFTSGFGRRWGRMHRGIDIAAPTGTPIKAADGGTVTFAGSNGSLGKMVKINHGNGLETIYGHCSKIHVRVGQKVYKGQHIANVGNTGRSTGPHLHLEVIKNGVHQNPSRYVR